MTAVAAVYQDGVLRPATPLPFADGTEVQVFVKAGVAGSPAVAAAQAEARSRGAAPPPPSHADVMALIRQIAALPEDQPPVQDGAAVARNVDALLYGGPRGAL